VLIPRGRRDRVAVRVRGTLGSRRARRVLRLDRRSVPGGLAHGLVEFDDHIELARRHGRDVRERGAGINTLPPATTSEPAFAAKVAAAESRGTHFPSRPHPLRGSSVQREGDIGHLKLFHQPHACMPRLMSLWRADTRLVSPAPAMARCTGEAVWLTAFVKRYPTRGGVASGSNSCESSGSDASRKASISISPKLSSKPSEDDPPRRR
jgi:hypothetical protein